MGCKECGKPKCNGECGCKSPKVLQINNPAEYITFHKVSIPAAMGDSTTNPPKIGAYRNALVYYEADHTSWMYSTDGIPTKLTNGLTDYNEAVNLPQINGHTLIGNQSSSDLGLQGELTAGANIQINGNTISATDTAYTAGNGIELDGTEIKAKIGDGLEFDNNREINIANIEQYAHFFDTVAEMQAATNLIDGSYARTIGYYAKNDGGAGTYKIRTIAVGDVIDGGSLIAMNDNTLVAELIIENNEVNIKQFGAKGDGTTDDTSVIRNAIAFCKANDASELLIPDGEFVISETLTIDFSNFALKGSKDSVLKYVGVGAGTASAAIELISVTGTNADEPVENILIDGINIDGAQQAYKGGNTLENPANTSTNPCARGILAMRGVYAKNLKISNCNLNDIYGEGIKISKSFNCIVINNTLNDVSSGNITPNGQTGYDNHGDAIVAFSSFNVTFENNTVVNNRKYLDGNSVAIGKPCGRSGLEFEYPINMDYANSDPDDIKHNAPDYSLIPLTTVGNKQYRFQYGSRMINNFVYGYTKAIHIESQVKCLVLNNTLLSNHIAVMYSTEAGGNISGNYINPLGIGAAPQSGYDGYYSGIAISQYGASSSRYGMVVSNNILEGGGKGVILACSNVQITNNSFKCASGVFTQLGNLEGIVVSDNTFNDEGITVSSFIYIYTAKSSAITGNVFYSETGATCNISGTNIQFVDNVLTNVSFNHTYGSLAAVTLRDNIFNGANASDGFFAYLSNSKGSVIDNNTFIADTDDFDNIFIVRFYGTVYKTIMSNNKFYLSSTRGNKEVVRYENIEDSTFANNICFGANDNSQLLVGYVSRRCKYLGNMMEANNGAAVTCTGGFRKWNLVEKNLGKIQSSGYYPNDGLSEFVNEYFNKSEKFYKYNLSASATVIGWVCVTNGYYVTTTWSSSDIAAGTLIKNQSDNVYKCVTKGSGASTVEPTHTTAENVTESDGYEWEYLGAVAVFKNLTI